MELYWGWVVCGAFFLLLTEASGIALAFNQTMIPLSKEYNMPITVVAWMGSLPIGVSFLSSPLGTFLNHKIGTRKTTMIGVLVTTAIMAVTPGIKSFVVLFILHSIIAGLARMLIMHPPFFLLADYFPYHHPRHVLATGINNSALPLATLIFNPVAVALVYSVGWRFTYSILALSMLVIGVSTTLTFRPLRDNEDQNHLSKNEKYEELVTSNEFVAKRAKCVMGTIWLIASTMIGMGYFTPLFMMAKQMVVQGLSLPQSSAVMVVIGSCELFSRVITAFFGDYCKGKITLLYVFSTIALSVVNCLGSMATSFTDFIVFAASLGILTGPILAALYSSCSEVLLGQEVHIVYTLYRIGLGLGGMIGLPLTGAIFDLTGSFRWAFYLNGMTYFTAALLYGIIFASNQIRPECIFPKETEQASNNDERSKTLPNDAH